MDGGYRWHEFGDSALLLPLDQGRLRGYPDAGRTTIGQAGAMTSAPHPPAAPAARAVDLRKTYGSGDSTVHALAGVSLDLEAGRFTAIMGPSGSGKSTLMHCMAALDTPSAGSVEVGGTDLSRLKDKDLTALRRERIGFVFQAFNLIPTLTAQENILLPLDLAGRKPDQEWLDTVVDAVGLRDRLGHRPASCPAGSSSASPAPGRWPASPRSSSRTSPPATSTARRGPRCCRSSGAAWTTSARPS